MSSRAQGKLWAIFFIALLSISSVKGSKLKRRLLSPPSQSPRTLQYGHESTYCNNYYIYNADWHETIRPKAEALEQE